MDHNLCGLKLLHAQLKLFCSYFKNHDITDFWGKLSGNVNMLKFEFCTYAVKKPEEEKCPNIFN